MIKNNRTYKHPFKLKGFTLLETLFVVLLTAIVISLTFVYFNTFQKYIQSQNKIMNYELEVLRFESLMNYDIDRCAFITQNGNAITMEGIHVAYEFFEMYLVRHQYENTDTLKGKRIDWLTETEEADNDELVKTIEVAITDLKNRQRNYIFFKDYDIKTKFEAYINKK
jgi:type II secretory pathway pseudopilin PulG